MNEERARKNRFSRFVLPGIGVLAGLVAFAGAILIGPNPTQAADVVVYKSPTCGCCTKWVDHLERNGFSVEVHEEQAMGAIKDHLNVPRRLQSCHTARVGGYLVEGHVPAEEIRRMLEEKPAIRGLAVPGMPMGSPGMEGPRTDPYDVISFDKAGTSSVYARY